MKDLNLMCSFHHWHSEKSINIFFFLVCLLSKHCPSGNCFSLTTPHSRIASTSMHFLRIPHRHYVIISRDFLTASSRTCVLHLPPFPIKYNRASQHVRPKVIRPFLCHRTSEHVSHYWNTF